MRINISGTLISEHGDKKRFFALAAVLGPRFKLCVFTSASASALVRQMLMEEYEQLAETGTSPVTAKQSPRTVNETSENESTSMLWNYFDELVKEQNSAGPASTPAVEAVVDAYRHEPVCGRKSNPLDYWKQKQSL